MARKEIHVEEEILNFPIEQVWSLAASFGAVKTWMPVDWATVQGDGVGAVRTVSVQGGVAKEQLEVSDHEKYVIIYRMLDPIPLPAKGAYGTWKLQSLSEHKTKFTWIAGAEEVDEDGVAFIKPIYQGWIKASLEGFVKALS
jgi:hypothetical protein